MAVRGHVARAVADAGGDRDAQRAQGGGLERDRRRPRLRDRRAREPQRPRREAVEQEPAPRHLGELIAARGQVDDRPARGRGRGERARRVRLMADVVAEHHRAEDGVLGLGQRAVDVAHDRGHAARRDEGEEPRAARIARDMGVEIAHPDREALDARQLEREPAIAVRPREAQELPALAEAGVDVDVLAGDVAVGRVVGELAAERLDRIVLGGDQIDAAEARLAERPDQLVLAVAERDPLGHRRLGAGRSVRGRVRGRGRDLRGLPGRRQIGVERAANEQRNEQREERERAAEHGARPACPGQRAAGAAQCGPMRQSLLARPRAGVGARPLRPPAPGASLEA